LKSITEIAAALRAVDSREGKNHDELGITYRYRADRASNREGEHR
jgi:hypothetical protein